MAKTYIGYAQREAETNVNWGAVATQFSDMLTEQQKLKEENEAADALVTQELATQLQSAPTCFANAWAGKHKPAGAEPIGAIGPTCPIGDQQSKQSNSNPIRNEWQ